MTKKVIGISAAFVLLAATGTAGAVIVGAGSQVRSVDPLPSHDLRDKRDLAGFSDDVWFGEVIEQLPQRDLGQSAAGAVPVSMFRVQVVETIKGSLAGEVVVAQDGGIDPASGDILLVDGDPLLAVGTTYLLATAYWQDGQAHSIVAEGLADLKAEQPEDRRQLRSAFGQAVANQRRPAGPPR